MKELVFLPDRDGRDEMGDAAGFVRVGASAASLGELAERLAAPAAASAVRLDEKAWRSAITLALLTDVWPDCGTSLKTLEIGWKTSSFASWMLYARPETEQGKAVHLLLLERGEYRLLLGVADADMGVRLPAQRVSLAAVAPERAAWIDRESGEVSDPVPFLSERDRTILLRRMALLGLKGPAVQRYQADLRSADEEETEAVRMMDPAALERLAARLEAVCGLGAFEAFSVQESAYSEGGNALLQCMGKTDDAPAADAGASRTYLWRGVPFACTSRVLGLTGVQHPAASAALQEIMSELTIMSGSSVRWNYETGMAMQRWLEDQRLNPQLLPQARARIEASCGLLLTNGRQVQTAVTLTWPWDASSGAVRALLQEALGESWLQAAANPFSDRLTKLSGHVLGDMALGTCCACADGVLLPPLSQALAACAAQEGMAGGLALDAMRFIPQEDGGITASFLLRGTGEVRLVRSYGPDELVVLTEEESPSVAVWPCLPMADWKAYYVFIRGGVEIAAACGGVWESAKPVESVQGETAPWRCMRAESYPSCLSVLRDGLCLGALPNMLPAYHVDKRGDVVVGIDLGSSQTTTAFAWDGVPTLMEGQMLTRLLVSPRDMAEDPFLSSLTPASVIPTAVALTGRGDTLFTDGYVYRPGSMQGLAATPADKLRTRLKWRADAESVRARRLLLHQVMLGAALTAASAGASGVSWRLTIPDDMGDDGREAMLGAMRSLSVQVAEETGLPLSAGVPAVEWAEESAALSTCLRAEGAGRGNCISADMGSGSIKLHLWLWGQNRPAAGAVVFEGVQDVLLRFYSQQPMRLLEDLADCGNEALLQDVLCLVDQFNPELSGPRQTDKLSLMLDLLLDKHGAAIGQHLSARAAANRPTYLQSIMLETEAAALFCTGLMLAQAGENTMQSHMLPADFSVCLTGRGVWLMDTLPTQSRNALQHLAHSPLRMEHPVRFITIRPAAKPAQSVALGLSVTRETGSFADAPLIATRASFSGLMLRLMQQLCASFPAHMWLLHEGLYDYQAGVLTPAGEDTIRRAAACCYDGEDELVSTVLTFVRTLRESPILPDGMFDTGA